MSNASLPTGFYFRLAFEDSFQTEEAVFEEVSGLSKEMGFEDVQNGGENRFVRWVPTVKKYSNLILKRGISASQSRFIAWCKRTLEADFSELIQAQTIFIQLLSKDGKALKTWQFINAWPVKWQVAGSGMEDQQILVESIEFAYSYFESK